MTRPSPARAAWAALLLAALLLAPACARLGAPLRPQPGQVEGGVFRYPQYGLTWPNPGGFIALRPQPGQGFVFGWQGPGSQAAWLWTSDDGALPEELVRTLARKEGWELKQGRAVSWKGLAAWEAGIRLGKRQGKLRALAMPRGAVALAALAPEGSASRAAELLEGPSLAPPGDVAHLVRYPDESLSLLAWWYTGAAANWKDIQRHNQLKDPRLVMGQEVLIPAGLAIRACPLPPELVPHGPTEAEAPATREADTGQEPTDPMKLKPVGPK